VRAFLHVVFVFQCLIPDGDFFAAVREGKATVVTDHIESFTESGVLLNSGRELPADIIITATGLKLQENFPMSTVQVSIDGTLYDAPSSFMYLGLMLSDVPNFAFLMGYANASWTLKVDVAAQYICRLLNHMELHGYSQCCPRRSADQVQLDEQFFGLTSGYLQRAQARMPKQSNGLWKLNQDFLTDLSNLSAGIGHKSSNLEFTTPPPHQAAKPMARL